MRAPLYWLVLAALALMLALLLLATRPVPGTYAAVLGAAPLPPYPRATPSPWPTCRFPTVTNAPEFKTATRVATLTPTLTPPPWAYWTAAPAAATATATASPCVRQPSRCKTPTRIVARKAVQEWRP